MSCAIPRDLDSQWFLSDVVLLAENAEGRELHVSRALLSSASPVFRAMFSSSFQEGTKGRIDISSDYNALKEVLRFVHHSSCDCLNTKMDEESLFPMYLVADQWDFATVRKLVLGMAKVMNYAIYEQILDMFGEQDGNVQCVVPENLESPWFSSDTEVVSRDGVRFHVSKELLSLDSFFRDQFFAEKKSSTEVSINSNVLQEILHRMHHIYCECKDFLNLLADYIFFRSQSLAQKPCIELPIFSNVLKEILHRMHHIRCECTNEITDPSILAHLHLANEWMFIQRMLNTPLPPMDAFIKLLAEETDLVIRREQKRALVAICEKLPRGRLDSFLVSCDQRAFFSKEDVVAICKVVPMGNMAKHPNVVADIYWEAASTTHMVPINFNKPWNYVNLLIRAKNSDGEPLYANKTVLTKFSGFFRKKLLENDWSEGKTPEGYDIITIDEDYLMLHRIVGVVHGCHRGINDRLSTPFLHEIYQTASEDRLDIPFIKEIILKNVFDEGTYYRMPPSFLDLAIRVNSDDSIRLVLKKMDNNDLTSWLQGSTETHSYFKDGKEIVVEAKPKENVFSVRAVRKICEHLGRVPRGVPY